MELQDNAAESAVIAGICQYGNDAYIEIEDIGIKAQTFKNPANYNIFLCIQKLAREGDLHLDIPTLFSAAKDLGIEHILKQPAVLEHINKVFTLNVNKNNIRKLAAKVRKLEIGRLISQQLENTKLDISRITGDEKLAHILGIAENSIFNLSSLIEDKTGPENLGEDFVSYINTLIENPIDQMGLPTGFHRWDKSIGGGLRKGTVNVIGARIKTGKSTVGINVANYLANRNIPVLYLDTELKKEDHLAKVLALNTEVPIEEIETGKFAKNPDYLYKVQNFACNRLSYDFESIAGVPFEDQLAIIRRWIHKKVGVNANKKANTCLVVYDYLKLMNSEEMSNKEMAEFQLLGFMMTGLHNFAVHYDIPILAFTQLNRDGITKESTDIASGSDRILWLCSNFSIFKPKSDEEIAADGPNNGNRKLVTLVARHGAGLESGDYINCHMKGWCAKITEGKTRFEIANNKDDNFDGGNDPIPFE